MPNPNPGGLPAVMLVLSLLAAGCTPWGHPPGTGGQAPRQGSSAAAADYLATAEPANRRLDELNAKAEDPALWNDAQAAQKLMRERQKLETSLSAVTRVTNELADARGLIEIFKRSKA